MYTNQASFSFVAHLCMNKNAPRQVGKGQSEEKQHPIPHAHLRARRAGKKEERKRKRPLSPGREDEGSYAICCSVASSVWPVVDVGRGRSRRLRLGRLLVGPMRWNFTGKEEKKGTRPTTTWHAAASFPQQKGRHFGHPKQWAKVQSEQNSPFIRAVLSVMPR